jgi:peptide/nickel transport system permease protein
LTTPSLVIGGLICLGLLLIGFFPAAFAPYNPAYQSEALQQINGQYMTAPFPPDSRFFLGTDLTRHDLLSRVVFNAGRTMAIVLGVVTLRLIVGCSIGWQIAWRRGTGHYLAGLLTSVSATIPTLLFAWVFIVAIGPDTGPAAFIIGLGLTGWAHWSQLVGDTIRHLRRQPFLEAAEVVGVPPRRQLSHYLLPHFLPVAIPTLAHEIAAALVLLAELGFLGVFYGHGAVVSLDQLEQGSLYAEFNDWGGMLAGTRLEAFNHWWLPLVPAGAFFIAIAGFSLLGEGLRAFVDPFD